MDRVAALRLIVDDVSRPRRIGSAEDGPERKRMTTGTASERATEIRLEGYTMAFYVAICLDAALVVSDVESASLVGLIWGTTIGLAVAHLFAFRLAARLVRRGEFGVHQSRLAAAQLVGAMVVAVIATVPALALGGTAGADGARFVTSALIGVAAFQIGRSSGASRAKSALLAGVTLLVASAVVFVKVVLVGH